MSWHPYQFAPILFCHFLKGLIAFPDVFKMYLENVIIIIIIYLVFQKSTKVDMELVIR